MYWILNTEEGALFLTALNQSQNLNLFEIDTIKIIIEFLYQRYKGRVLKIRLPLYLLYLSVFGITTYFHETTVMELLYNQECKAILEQNNHGNKDFSHEVYTDE